MGCFLIFVLMMLLSMPDIYAQNADRQYSDNCSDPYLPIPVIGRRVKNLIFCLPDSGWKNWMP